MLLYPILFIVIDKALNLFSELEIVLINLYKKDIAKKF